MALATRCPACSTVFRIGTGQAAAKGGMVRCGQCRHVFDALDALVRVEDLHVIEEVIIDPMPAPPAVVDRSVDEPLAEEARDAPLPERPSSIDAPAHEPEAVPAIDEGREPVDREPVFGEWWLPESGTPGTAVEPIGAADESLGASRDDAGRMLSGRRTDLQWPTPDPVTDEPSFLRPSTTAVRTSAAARWSFGLLSLLATIALLAQAAWLWRDDLAVRWPAARPWLAAACAPLGCQVGYPARVDAITIESVIVQATGSAPNAYRMSALLRNRDAVDLRYPFLELTLTDVENRVVLRRTLRPEDYLPARGAPGGFAAGSEQQIRVLFELSDLRFAGYRLDRFNP